MLARGEAVGVFQVESPGMRRALVDMRPDRFEDLIALVALYRPGPMANIPTYCARKHGDEEIDYLHPKLEPILAETYGVIIYQEQVQQIAQVLAGYTLGEADLLRRAMGKKIKAEMDAQREPLLSGAVERGIAQAAGGRDLRRLREVRRIRLQQVALGAVCAHHLPDRLSEGALSGRVPGRLDDARHGQYRQARRIPRGGAAARHQGRAALGQSLGRRFDVGRQHILYALAALKGVGAQAVEHRRRARRAAVRRPRRLSPPRQSARRQQARAGKARRAGAFDALEPNRARASRRSTSMLASAQRAHENAAVGQNELFGGTATREPLALPAVEPWLPAERLQKEYDAIGFFLSGHPLDDYAGALKRLRVQSWAEFARAVKAGATAGRVAGTVVARTERRTKTGNKMGIIGLSDPTGHYEAVLFSEGLGAIPRPARAGRALCCCSLSAELQGDEVARASSRSSRSTRPAAKMQKGLRVFLRDQAPIEGVAKRLEDLAGDAAGQGGGRGQRRAPARRRHEVEVKLPGRFRVSPQIAGAIKAVPGVVEVQAL